MPGYTVIGRTENSTAPSSGEQMVSRIDGQRPDDAIRQTPIDCYPASTIIRRTENAVASSTCKDVPAGIDW